MARLHVALPFDRVSFQRFLYISDCVLRDAKKEEEEIRKARAEQARQARQANRPG